MSDFNLIKIDGKPLEKLIDTIQKGCGFMVNHFFEADAKKIRRMGNAKIEVEMKKIIEQAEAESQLPAIMLRAQTRERAQSLKKQQSIEAVIDLSQDELKGQNVSDDPVDEDWATRFFDFAQDIGNEEMQLVWAKILAGEIKKPKSFSLRTLEVLRNLSAEEAADFQDAVSIATGDRFIVFEESINELKKYNLDYKKIMKLRDAQLLLSGNNDYLEWLIKAPMFWGIKTGGFVMLPKTKESKLKLSVLNFSKAGQEISPLIEVSANNDYLVHLQETITKKGFKIAGK
ncbi:MAG: DUF2806 domain-containing protein [Patescibacteria group bacterium]